MKTRVVEHWNSRLGQYEYSVQQWSRWNDGELLRAYPEAWDWRYVATFGDLERAEGVASRLATVGRHEPRVMCEFGYNEAQP